MIKLWYRTIFGLLTKYYQKNNLIFLNAGFADLETQDGVFVKTLRDKFDVYRFQLYHHLVLDFGGL